MSGVPPPNDGYGEGASRNAVSAGTTCPGASSMSQCPEPAMIWPRTLVATCRTWSPGTHRPDFSPARTSIGMVSGRVPSSAKSLRVALEVVEVLEAGSHRPGLRVGLGVDPSVRLGHRVVSIGREVVPEVLEVDPLAPLHQCQRHLAVEVEVPQVAQQPDVLPVADARQEGVHQHDALGGSPETARRRRTRPSGRCRGPRWRHDRSPSDATSSWMSTAMFFLS